MPISCSLSTCISGSVTFFMRTVERKIDVLISIAAGLFLGQPYLCLTSDMLKSLVSALVFSHPPEKFESPKPHARDLAVFVRTFQMFLAQRAQRIEDQR